MRTDCEARNAAVVSWPGSSSTDRLQRSITSRPSERAPSTSVRKCGLSSGAPPVRSRVPTPGERARSSSTLAAVAAPMFSAVRAGELSTWQCAHARLQSLPMLTCTVRVARRRSGSGSGAPSAAAPATGRRRMRSISSKVGTDAQARSSAAARSASRRASRPWRRAKSASDGARGASLRRAGSVDAAPEKKRDIREMSAPSTLLESPVMPALRPFESSSPFESPVIPAEGGMGCARVHLRVCFPKTRLRRRPPRRRPPRRPSRRRARARRWPPRRGAAACRR